MNLKEILKQVIRINQVKEVADLKRREVFVPLNTGKVISLLGSRRAGKTHLLYLTMKDLQDHGVDRKRIIYINFEDERLVSDDFAFDLILQAYREMYPGQVLSECFFFFDEIQNFPNWEKFIRRVYDEESKNIFLTGSNAHFLSTEIATSLRGRTISLEVFPLNFSEFLRFRDLSADYHLPTNRAVIQRAFDEYMRFGGFPEVVNMEGMWVVRTLQEYYNVMIYRDMIERYAISQPLLLKYFIKKIFAGVTKPVSINRIYNEFKSNKYPVSKNTLYDFFEMIQTSFVAIGVEKFDHSEIKRANMEKKAYAIDSGLLAAVDHSSSDNMGKLLENTVLMEWIKYGKKPFFYKQTKECDLVWEEPQIGFQALQICYSLKEADTQRRELTGLFEACTMLGLIEGTILTADEEYELRYKNLKVQVFPAWKYFLENLGSVKRHTP